ncbi:putative ATP-dependent acetyltransferase [Escherichia coli]|uniref:Putative ATP-dependent acetyltransferase n=1 Tax=Escherichia coli TaxID=562 RepID=A0A377D4G3_ECOLX|nr:putative ATP-dependent acetyltransferase [Escherichia coli]
MHQGNIFYRAAGENEIAGALWLVDEGGLSQQLSQAVWAGFRRPRGNLVAQSLAAHGSIHWQRHCVDGGSAG